MRDQTDQLTVDLSKTYKQNTELLGVIAEYRSVNDALEESAAKSAEEVSNLQDELSAMKAKAALQSSDHLNMEFALDRVTQLESEKQLVIEELNHLKSEVVQLSHTENILRTERDGFQREKESLSKQLGALQESLDRNANKSQGELKFQVCPIFHPLSHFACYLRPAIF